MPSSRVVLSLPRARGRFPFATLLAVLMAALVSPIASAAEPPLRFSVKQLHVDNNEGAAVGDINGDGRPDIVAGEFWYAAPGFDVKHPVREIAPFGKDYMQNNGDHLYDIDGDGDLDVVAGGFIPREVHWYENPGTNRDAATIDWSKPWKQHLLGTTESFNEITYLRDMDGDGKPEYVANSWRPTSPMLIWSIVKKDGKPALTKHVVGPSNNGHGMGFGDLNGDGLEDIVFGNGWYERPKGDAMSKPWKLHKTFTLPHASCPILVRDLNGDGLNDLIWGSGHNFGLYWDRQTPSKKNAPGQLSFERKVIDDSWSQAHVLIFADIDGDGQDELITGKRVRAHSGRDPGASERTVLCYYDFDKKSQRFTRQTIAEGLGDSKGQGMVTGVGTGLQIRVADLNGDGKLDIVVPGKSGTHVLFNEGRSDKLPAPRSEAGFTSLFDGKTLKGWEGDASLWSVKDGVIVGQTVKDKPIPRNTFLTYKGDDGKATVGDFELRIKVKVEGNNNSGIQYRSMLHDGHRVTGYQCDIHPNPPYNGMLYEEGGRGIIAQRWQNVIIEPSGKKQVISGLGDPTAFKPSEWNEYTIIARGHRLTHQLNGVTTAVVVDNQGDRRSLSGVLALQLHRGAPMTAMFKDIRLKTFATKAPPKKKPTKKPAPKPKKKPAAQKPAAKKQNKQAQAPATQRVIATQFVAAKGKGGKGKASKAAADLKVLINHDFKSGTHGWKLKETMQVQAKGGVLHVITKDKDPYMTVAASGPAGHYLIQVWAQRDNRRFMKPQLFWETTKAGFSEKQSVKLTRVRAPGNLAQYRAKFEADAPITSVRLDPDDRPGPFQIDRVQLRQTFPPRVTTASKSTPAARIQLPKGFKAELIYEVPKDKQGSWVALAVDSKGRLITSDQYDETKLYRITPPRDGAKMKIEEIKLGVGAAQGLCFAFDSLYAVMTKGEEPGLYRLRDTDGDDQFDEAKLLRGFGKVGGEHGPHAVIPGPNGKYLYIAAGNHTPLPSPEKSLVPRVWGEDHLLPRMWDARGHARGKLAPGGWVCRTDKDGKTFEVVSIGFRNQYDIAFNDVGDLFTYDADMEWDIGTPWYRPTRVNHVTVGSEFGWRSGTGKWPDYYPDSLPAVVDIGPGSPTGVVFGQGAKFPAKYQKALFIADWSYGKMYAVHMKPNGASYAGEAEVFMQAAPLPLTDMVISPTDGAMYFTMGGRNTQSGLYRVTYTGKESTALAKASPITSAGAKRRELEARVKALADGKTGVAMRDLPGLLSHDDRHIRFAARTALEHLPRAKWESSMDFPDEAIGVIEVVIAAARVTKDKSHQVGMLKALNKLDWNKLDRMERLALLRAYQLVFTRLGQPTDEAKAGVIDKLNKHYPSDGAAGGFEINRQLSRILLYLDAPAAVSRTLALLLNAPTQEEQIDHAMVLRTAVNGWSIEQRRAYFKWFNQAYAYGGGASFEGFLKNIKKEAVAKLSMMDKQTLGDDLKDKPQPLPPLPQPKGPGKEWTVDELAKAAEADKAKRDFENGRKMFAAGGCFLCHRFQGSGGIVGPDLSGVGGRFSARDLLESIIEPNKTISDQYESTTFDMEDGTQVTGRIVNLSKDQFRVSTDMFNPGNLTTLIRGEVISMRPSPISLMPAGLINRLNKQEALDLLAYLRSGGNRKDPRFKQ